MTGDGYRVEPAAMSARAGALDDAAEQVRQARSAATTVQLDTGAYGWLLVWLPPVVLSLQDSVIAALTDRERDLREAAADLRKAAHGYTGTDRAAAQSYLDGWPG